MAKNPAFPLEGKDKGDALAELERSAKAYRKTGEYEKALRLYRRVFAIEKNLFGKDSAEFKPSLFDMNKLIAEYIGDSEDDIQLCRIQDEEHLLAALSVLEKMPEISKDAIKSYWLW
ncbi:hypothetical protein AGMMS50268_01160 [Spirochaetia bacterium]|nr:hypothetical protein AGMMS50268_01160 [Spirochaetia bacterium]